VGPKSIGWVALSLFFSSAAPTATVRPRMRVPAGAPAAKAARAASASVIVYVRDAFGFPLDAPPAVSLETFPRRHPLSRSPRHIAGAWVFARLRPGEKLFVHVEAPGYRAARKPVAIPRRKSASAYAIFFLDPSDSRIEFHPPQPTFLLPPLAQKQTQQAIGDLSSGKMGPARKHLKKALRFAPKDPLVNELAGIWFLRKGQPRQAELHLKKVVSINPGDGPALLALGVARYRLGDFAGAIRILEDANRRSPSSWQVQWMLAASYLREMKFGKARQAAEHAQMLARKAGREDTGAALLLAVALERLGEHKLASSTLTVFRRKNPHSPLIVEFLGGSKSPRGSADGNGRGRLSSERMSHVFPALPLPRLQPGLWTRPDVDAQRPFLIAGAACPLPEVLKGAAARAVEFVKDVQQFTAIEDYQTVEIKPNGKLSQPFQRKFSYLVFLQQTRPDLIQSTVMRDRSFGLTSEQMGGPLMDTGSPVLALVFHPVYAKDFQWKCEGLGEWRGQPAWVIHFQQRPDRPISRLHGFETMSSEYLAPLEGLAWVTTNEDRVAHLETDLMKPLKAVELQREHFAIDYREVAFHSHPVRLWLPAVVNSYVEYRGHLYHHYHHFAHFELFWAGPKSEHKRRDRKERKR
jgi:tetratricopeptide (TPR) repeat protein